MEHLSLREINLEGIKDLWWVTVDKKAFDSPLRDWIDDRDKFLEFARGRDTIVQAGGNCGMYARFYGNYFKNVYTFEPQPDNFKCLSLNCGEDSKYKIFNAGLGATKTTANLKHPSTVKRRNMGVWQTFEDPTGSTNIITIDSLALTSCDVIHLDIEDYEPYALRGAKETINLFHPTIILEAGHGSDVAEEYGYSVIYKGTSDWIMTFNA